MQEHTKVVEEEMPPVSDAANEKANTAILIMPESLKETAPIYAGTTESVLKLLRQAAVPVALAEDRSTLDLRDNRSAEWIGPTLFVTPLLLSENPLAVSLALNVISAYVVDLFKGTKKEPNLTLNILFETERGKSVKKVEFSGPATALPEVKDVLLALNKKP